MKEGSQNSEVSPSQRSASGSVTVPSKPSSPAGFPDSRSPGRAAAAGGRAPARNASAHARQHARPSPGRPSHIGQPRSLLFLLKSTHFLDRSAVKLNSPSVWLQAAPGDTKGPISLVLRLRYVYLVKDAARPVMFDVLLKPVSRFFFFLLFQIFIEIQRRSSTTFALSLCQGEVSWKDALWWAG